jgi:hypothetical protein
MEGERKTTLQNFIDWLRENQKENSMAIEKASSMLELERLEIEDSFHQAQVEMVKIVSELFNENLNKETLDDREDSEEYYRNKFIFNDNVIGKN